MLSAGWQMFSDLTTRSGSKCACVAGSVYLFMEINVFKTQLQIFLVSPVCYTPKLGFTKSLWSKGCVHYTRMLTIYGKLRYVKVYAHII